MIPADLVATVNGIRTDFLQALKLLEQSPSFAALLHSAEQLRAEFGELQRIAAAPRVQQPCSPTFSCAIVGSSGDGKTSIMAELFPDLADRGWLQTDKTDTTSQALVVNYAAAGSAELDEVVVHSWDIDQITRLVKAAASENAAAGILCRYQPTAVEVDGTDALFAVEDRRSFKFDVRQVLQPLPGPLRLSASQRNDPRFVRTLTVKEEASKVVAEPVVAVNGASFHTLQLRTVVQAIALRDSFRQMADWTGHTPEQLAGLEFIDTPGLNVSGSMKDEVLRNVLGKKNQQIVIELLRHDEVDLLIHLVLCGNQSAFARLWRGVLEQCDAEELTDLGDRLILAVNGTNIYFTNPDLRRKWADPQAAEREGDHFAVTLEDNILKKMAESGTVRPARICFLDSRRIVEANQGSYQQAYAAYRPVLEGWAHPGGIGRKTLERLGLLECFEKNVAALCDPEDRGQGFLVRQVVELAKEKGPALFLRKYLRRNQLHGAAKKLRAMVGRYYDPQGGLNRQATREAVRRCLPFLDPAQLATVETFARQHLDLALHRLVPETSEKLDSGRWFSDAFNEACKLLGNAIRQRSNPPREVFALFAQYFQERVNLWKSQWGVRTGHLPAPAARQPAFAALARHALRLHMREILYQILIDDQAAESAQKVAQTPVDRSQVQQAMARLDAALGKAASLCQRFGVPVP